MRDNCLNCGIKIALEQLYLLSFLFLVFGLGMLIPLFYDLSDSTTLFLGAGIFFTCSIGMMGLFLFEVVHSYRQRRKQKDRHIMKVSEVE